MNKFTSFVVLVLFLCSAVIQGQEQAQEQTQGEGQAITQGRVVIASDDGSGAPSVMTFSTLGDGGAGAILGGSGIAFGGGDIVSLAQNSEVQKEIELVGEQQDQLKQIDEDFSKRLQDVMAELRDSKGNFDLSKAKTLGERMQALQQEREAALKEVFLPHQFDRLRQISLQNIMRSNGETSMLSDKRVIEELGLTEEQQDKLKAKSKELNAELEKKIKKLKEQAREELFGELTRDQRDKLKSMLGEDFEMKESNLLKRLRSRGVRAGSRFNK